VAGFFTREAFSPVERVSAPKRARDGIESERQIKPDD
jgi:hypothetical protein